MHVLPFPSSLMSGDLTKGITFSLGQAHSTSELFMPHITSRTDAAVKLHPHIKPTTQSHVFYLETLPINIT